MKILFTALAVPFPPTNGQRLRNWALLQALKEEGHEVTLVSFSDRPASAAERRRLEEVCLSVELVHLPFSANGPSHASRFLSLASPLPYGAWRHRSLAMRRAIEQQLRREKFDAILCDDIYNISNLPAAGGAPGVLNKHDITHVIFRRYLAYERNPLKLSYGWVEYAKLRRWEIDGCMRSAGVLVCSEHDCELLKSLCPGARFAVASNVIDTDGYAPASSDDGRTVLYVGALDWLPNQDAVRFFANSILPLLRSQVPEVRFRVIGRNPPERFRKQLARLRGLELGGWVADIRSEIARAAVCVVPLRIGSGTRLKILEAAAMGKSVVSTRIGAEGLDFAHNEEIVLADRPEEFSSAVATLLRDPTRRRSLGQAARRCVVARYSLPILRRALREALEQFAGRPAVG